MRIDKNQEALLFSMQEIGPFISSSIKSGKQVLINITGNSMSPLLKENRDKALLTPISTPVKKNDVVLYLRDNGQYVLHRVFNIKNGEYIMLGDAQVYCERGVTDRHLIAKACEFVINGKRVSTCSFLYLCYAYFWKFVYPIRLLKTKGVNFFKRILKRPTCK